ncbi:hypothetical protein [Amycolatopsis jiangsuensis]|uniref:Neocarzinostatin family protein n=1 Tax=Amycolatopsis jiangsuensis TaxID=1181879 RepID=A0A840IL72_9PSEU|nr:hypothetical protein [Amycolatopsis jiangsuensis]MBB4683071.1 hypothetical protein [Amycolatopsis jiangsuensis]
MSVVSRKGKIVIGAAAVAAVAVTTTGFTVASAVPEQGTGNTVGVQQQQPPKGARATVEVTPNPAAPGEEITITGTCADGTGLKRVVGNSPERPSLEDVTIVDPGPEKFTATAKVSDKLGYGVGPVLVDCGGEAGVTLLVTRGH